MTEQKPIKRATSTANARSSNGDGAESSSAASIRLARIPGHVGAARLRQAEPAVIKRTYEFSASLIDRYLAPMEKKDLANRAYLDEEATYLVEQIVGGWLEYQARGCPGESCQIEAATSYRSHAKAMKEGGTQRHYMPHLCRQLQQEGYIERANSSIYECDGQVKRAQCWRPTPKLLWELGLAKADAQDPRTAPDWIDQLRELSRKFDDQRDFHRWIDLKLAA